MLKGEITVVNNEGESTFGPGSCIGFPANASNAHHITNKASCAAEYLEVGNRYANEEVFYPDIDLLLRKDGFALKFFHKSGEPYN